MHQLDNAVRTYCIHSDEIKHWMLVLIGEGLLGTLL